MTSPGLRPETRMAERTFALEVGLSAPLTVGLGIALVIEGAVLHLWVASRSQAWAWAITVINAVTLLWLWREYNAGARSALTVGDSSVELVVGNRLRCRIPRTAIASTEAATWRSVPDMAADYVNTAKPLEPNVMLVLREPVTARLSLGVRKRVSRIGLRVHDGQTVIDAMAAHA